MLASGLRHRSSSILAALVGLTCLGTQGCAAAVAESRANWRATHCNYDGAYAAGLETYRSGQPLSITDFSECTVKAEREVALRGYRQGYEAALALDTNRPAPGVVVVESKHRAPAKEAEPRHVENGHAETTAGRDR